MPYECATSSSDGFTTLEAAESQMESATESWGSLDAIAEKLNAVAEEASNGGIIRSSRPVWVQGQQDTQFRTACSFLGHGLQYLVI